MGTSSSKDSGSPLSDVDNGASGQFYVSLNIENFKCRWDLVPHVFGSIPIIGCWDSARAVAMERESASTWELSFVVPPNHEMLVFKFLLKPRDGDVPCFVEDGEERLLINGNLEGGARPALFKLPECVVDDVLEYRVSVKANIISPFDLAASWRAYRENLRPSTVRGIPDVSMNAASEARKEVRISFLSSSMDFDDHSDLSTGLELDLERYVVHPPTRVSADDYAADLTETPRSVGHDAKFTKYNVASCSHSLSKVEYLMADHAAADKIFTDPLLIEAKQVGIFSALKKQDGQKGHFAETGVDSPTLFKSDSECALATDFKMCSEEKAIPAAAGAVAVAAVTDRMHGPKEDRRLAIVLVGLPARGKTFTAAKLTRYLRWLGHETKHFNVGKYRRLKHGANQAADFFRGDNPEGVEARNEVAAIAMGDLLAWMQEGGQVGIFDATNSTRERRNLLMKMAKGKCKIIFLETICNDELIIERNIRLKIQQSPDYAEETDFEAGLRDFKERLANYEKVYEPVEEGSYIKMVDMVSGNGGQIQVNNISGYLPGRIVFFLVSETLLVRALKLCALSHGDQARVNTHLTPRPILLTRHGESQDNVRGRIGGDSILSEAGEIYSKKLADFVEKRLKYEKMASVWTSTLQRTVITAAPIVGFPKIQWRALDEINAGVCDGMTYEEIKRNMPEEYDARKKEKLCYRYPRGESYLDIIQRLEPVIIELERQRAPVVVISHQAVLRALYGYFADKPLKEIPYVEVPLHTIIEIQMGVTGVQEKRYKLMD